jgi:hypothetical protein
MGPQEPKPEQVPYLAGQLECPPVRCLQKPTLSSPTPGQTAQWPAGPVGLANQQGEPLGRVSSRNSNVDDRACLLLGNNRGHSYP